MTPVQRLTALGRTHRFVLIIVATQMTGGHSYNSKSRRSINKFLINTTEHG